eukprot:COSAG06_NODE_4735_length_3992_cov_4.927067_4_plen_204_part_00
MRFLSAGEDGEPIPPPEPEPIDEEAVSRCLLFLPQQQQQQQLALAASATKPHSWHSLPRQLSFFSSVFLPLSADRAHILSFSFVFVRSPQIKAEYEAKIKGEVEAQTEALAAVDEICAERGIVMPFASVAEDGAPGPATAHCDGNGSKGKVFSAVSGALYGHTGERCPSACLPACLLPAVCLPAVCCLGSSFFCCRVPDTPCF